MAVCKECGGTVIEYDAAAGNGFCVQCGNVVEENMIVSEVTFGESSSGAAVAHGSFLGQGATHARMSGPYGNRGGGESREQTIANATARIQKIASVLRLSDIVCLAATRMYTLAVEHKFTKGRKSMNVVAVCLYVACRQKETRNYMLIDFSDLLQVNVFELGHIYLQLVQTLGLRLPLVDPSHYISRFAALLEFGDETHKVATDAVRLVQRFDRDWMTRGRRPAGICGAALLLAARMNNFRRSVEEIVQVVKIADTTLKKRLDEFKNTPSGSLTLADFRNVWLDEEMDPPAFTKGKEKERKMAEEELEDTEQEENAKPKKKKRIGKRKRVESDGDGETSTPQPSTSQLQLDPALFDPPDAPAAPAAPAAARIPIDPALLNEGILADLDIPPPLPISAYIHQPPDLSNIDPSLLCPSPPSMPSAFSLPTSPPPPPPDVPNSSSLLPSSNSSSLLPLDPLEETANTILTSEVSNFLTNTQGTRLVEALDEVEQQRLAQIAENVVDDLLGLDEDELDRFILNEEEVRVKERIWVEMNREYLEALAAKGDPSASSSLKSRKRQKTGTSKPRDASTANGSTAVESVRNMISKNPRYSKRINYDALKDLFVDQPGLLKFPGTPTPGDDKDDGGEEDKDDDDEGMGMYTIDGDKSDGEMGVVVIEGDGDVTKAVGAKGKGSGRGAVGGEDGYEEEGSDKEEGVGWEEDGYEQEV